MGKFKIGDIIIDNEVIRVITGVFKLRNETDCHHLIDYGVITEDGSYTYQSAGYNPDARYSPVAIDKLSKRAMEAKIKVLNDCLDAIKGIKDIQHLIRFKDGKIYLK